MTIKLNVGVSRKVCQPNYGSRCPRALQAPAVVAGGFVSRGRPADGHMLSSDQPPWDACSLAVCDLARGASEEVAVERGVVTENADPHLTFG